MVCINYIYKTTDQDTPRKSPNRLRRVCVRIGGRAGLVPSPPLAVAAGLTLEVFFFSFRFSDLWLFPLLLLSSYVRALCRAGGAPPPPPPPPPAAASLRSSSCKRRISRLEYCTRSMMSVLSQRARKKVCPGEKIALALQRCLPASVLLVIVLNTHIKTLFFFSGAFKRPTVLGAASTPGQLQDFISTGTGVLPLLYHASS